MEISPPLCFRNFLRDHFLFLGSYPFHEDGWHFDRFESSCIREELELWNWGALVLFGVRVRLRRAGIPDYGTSPRHCNPSITPSRRCHCPSCLDLQISRSIPEATRDVRRVVRFRVRDIRKLPYV